MLVDVLHDHTPLRAAQRCQWGRRGGWRFVVVAATAQTEFHPDSCGFRGACLVPSAPPPPAGPSSALAAAPP
eukprot:5860356-Prymnesium_polylepis.2